LDIDSPGRYANSGLPIRIFAVAGRLHEICPEKSLDRAFFFRAAFRPYNVVLRRDFSKIPLAIVGLHLVLPRNFSSDA
jgi:hypothetical protein